MMKIFEELVRESAHLVKYKRENDEVLSLECKRLMVKLINTDLNINKKLQADKPTQ
jgi:hypothetical protein